MIVTSEDHMTIILLIRHFSDKIEQFLLFVKKGLLEFHISIRIHLRRLILFKHKQLDV